MSETEGTEASEVDAALEALADARRRRALRCLQPHRELTLPDLAEEVTVKEADAPLPELPAERVQEVYFSLYHTHVPKLEAAGLVRYSQERDLVECRDGLEDDLRTVRQVLDGILGEREHQQ